MKHAGVEAFPSSGFVRHRALSSRWKTERSTFPRSDVIGHTLSFVDRTMSRRLVDEAFNGARLLPKVELSEVLQAICSGEPEAAVFPDSFGDPDFVKRSDACGRGLLLASHLPQAKISLGIGASARTPNAIAAAKLIRSEIETFDRDGTLTSVFFRWLLNASNVTDVMDELAGARRGTRVLSFALAFLLFILGLTLRQNRAVRLAKLTAETASWRRPEPRRPNRNSWPT
jgi:hypothetical protein